jgi:hypothetical protein
VKPQNPAAPVLVEAEQTTAGIDAELELDGVIKGTITDPQARPIANGLVCFNSVTEYHPECVFSDGSGHYEFPHLPPGELNVNFTGRVCAAGDCQIEACEAGIGCPRTYIPQYWQEALNDEDATLLTLNAGETIGGKNATLTLGGQITGRVTLSSLDAPPLEGFVVCASAETTPAVGQCVGTNANGEYTIAGLNSSEWLVEFKEDCPNEEPCPGNYESTTRRFELTAPETKTVDVSIKELLPHTPAFTSAPMVTGVPVVSGKLSCSPGTWTNHPTAIRYGWLRNGIPIPGAEAATYTSAPEDQDNVITCEVEVSNSAGGVEALGNNVPIGPEVAPAFTSQPTLGGTPAVGSTLTCTEGAAANYPLTSSFAWLRNGSAIPGQAEATYNVTGDDQGALLTCRVTMTNGAGLASADSNGLTVPARGEQPKPSTGSSTTATGSTTTAKPGTASASTKATTGHTVSITLTCKGEYACQGSLKLSVKRKGKTVTIGTATFNLAAGSSRAVAVKLNATGEKLVKEAGKKGLKVQLSGTGVGSRTLQIH